MSVIPANDTIVALSSGSLPSGVAVIRLSGLLSRDIVAGLTGSVPPSRSLALKVISTDSGPLDKGLVTFFPGPQSFTGEDCAELHLHGSPAVVRAMLRHLSSLENVRLAEAGEFTRRAFENGKLDLTEIEGLGDLIAAETESQRVQALSRMSGGLSGKIDGWRHMLLDLRAEIEARLDFSDESDVDEELPPAWFDKLNSLSAEIITATIGVTSGRIVREGFRVALAGQPNAGKSSLLNALAKSELAIVTDEAGTTRDIKEVPLDLGGQLVIMIDMAGLRDADSVAETEGVRRAQNEIRSADLVLWLSPPGERAGGVMPKTEAPLWQINSKSDLQKKPLGSTRSVSARTGAGLDTLMADIKEFATEAAGGGSSVLVSRERDRLALEACSAELRQVGLQLSHPELAAEALRRASVALARLTGHLDSEAVLDRLFTGFCIGK